MATIATIQRKSIVLYKAIIKQHGCVIKTKTSKTKNSAPIWAKQPEGNLDYLDALGIHAAAIIRIKSWQTNACRKTGEVKTIHDHQATCGGQNNRETLGYIINVSRPPSFSNAASNLSCR